MSVTHHHAWWRSAAVYQIYPRSFNDANHDGLGDIPGIIERIPYLVSLHVDAVWLNPFYPSELADGGYDVIDYRNIDPRLGSLSDFDDLVSALHDQGVKLLIDLVPNHSSDQHPWFQEALRSPVGSPARDRYIFRDGKGPDGSLPPSNWQSQFGGSAWTRVSDGQWYLHLFAREQPDFNWNNQQVRDDFVRTLRFWSDRGVDGFRVDVAHGLTKDLQEPLRDIADPKAPLPPDGSHPLYDRDEVHSIYTHWRQVLNEYHPPRAAVAEAWVHPSRTVLYARPTELGQAFNFDLLQAPWDASEFQRIIEANVASASAAGASSTWVFSNHDVVRHASRYGLPPEHLRTWLLSDGKTPAEDQELGARRARAAILLMLALPGSAYMYQGEELGLREVADLPREVLQDPMWERTGHTTKGRDGCRVPIPWENTGISLGFSTVAPHLPQPEWFKDSSVQAQDEDPGSTLNMYREALGLRRQLNQDEDLRWCETTSDTMVHYERSNGWHSVTNFAATDAPLPPSLAGYEIILSSQPVRPGFIPGNTTVWMIAPQ